MKIYYAISPRQKYEAIYSPQEFIVYNRIYDGSLPRVHWNDDFFKEIDQRFFNGKLSINILEDGGWVIKEIDISNEDFIHYRKKYLESERQNDSEIMERTLVRLFASLLPQVDGLRHDYLNRPRLNRSKD